MKIINKINKDNKKIINREFTFLIDYISEMKNNRYYEDYKYDMQTIRSQLEEIEDMIVQMILSVGKEMEKEENE